jgi:DNA-binding response OmpR family regulator
MSARRTPINESLVVLVIDDDFDARNMFGEYLRSKNLTVFTAADGRVGLTKVNELTPDVIVLDLAMPKVDGWTVLKHVRESSLTKNIAVVVISALSDARDAAYRAGCDAYLMKPCPPDVVYLQIVALWRCQSDPRAQRSFV